MKEFLFIISFLKTKNIQYISQNHNIFKEIYLIVLKLIKNDSKLVN